MPRDEKLSSRKAEASRTWTVMCVQVPALRPGVGGVGSPRVEEVMRALSIKLCVVSLERMNSLVKRFPSPQISERRA